MAEWVRLSLCYQRCLWPAAAVPKNSPGGFPPVQERGSADSASGGYTLSVARACILQRGGDKLVEVTIGADPEFSLTQDGEFVDADEMYPTRRSTYGEIGYDGHSATGELRPEPSISPVRVVDNIHFLLRRLRDLLDSDVMVHAGSYPCHEPIGGHLHFGMKPEPTVIRALDAYLSLPLLYIEEAQPARFRRIDHSYGYLGWVGGEMHGVRRQPWGFEYRTPGSWIVSKYIAKGVLCLGHAIVDAVLRGVKLPLFNIDYKAFAAHDTERFKPLIPAIKSTIFNLPELRESRSRALAVASLFSLISLGKTWREGKEVDCLPFWGIRPVDKQQARSAEQQERHASVNLEYSSDDGIGECVSHYAISAVCPPNRPVPGNRRWTVYLYGLSEGRGENVIALYCSEVQDGNPPSWYTPVSSRMGTNLTTVLNDYRVDATVNVRWDVYGELARRYLTGRAPCVTIGIARNLRVESMEMLREVIITILDAMGFTVQWCNDEESDV